MNYGDMRGLFLQLLNRTDCDNDLADTFIALGIRRIERSLRTPQQKMEVVRTIGPFWPGFEIVPEDSLGIYAVQVDNTILKRITEEQVGYIPGYYIDGPLIKFSPEPAEGQLLRIMYYSQWVIGVPDDAFTPYTKVFSDLVVYAALSFAGDYFQDVRQQAWEAKAMALVSETQAMADMEENYGLTQITNYAQGLI